MQEYTNLVLPMVAEFFDNSYTQMPRPADVIYVAGGQTGPEACVESPEAGVE